MGETIDCIWASFLLGVMLCGIGLLISVPRKMHTLVLLSALAPVLVPLCISAVLLVQYIKSLCKNRVHDGQYTNTNRGVTVATVEMFSTLRPEPREPPRIRVRSFNVASLPTYIYDKEAVEGGPECSICRELYKKDDEIVRLPLCIHPFHKKCVKNWLETQQTCPVCRCRVDLEIPGDVALIID